MMKSLLVFISFLITCLSDLGFCDEENAYLRSNDKFFFEEIKEEVDLNSLNLLDNCEPSNKPLIVRYGLSNDLKSRESPDLKIIETSVDQIINIGQLVFSIVEHGKPVVRTELKTANALPRGVKCWLDLDGWGAPVSKVFRVVYQNDLGGKVVDYKFRVSFLPKGAVNGIGQYIANATVRTASLHVGWGYHFDSEVSIPVIFNQGTPGSPRAGMQMDVSWKVKTAVNYNEGAKSFYLSGEGNLIEMN